MPRRRLMILVTSLLLAVVLIPAALWVAGESGLVEELDPDMLPEWVFEALESVGIASNAFDPDRPPVGKKFDEAEYLRQRSEYIARLRGSDPNRPALSDDRVQAAQQYAAARAQKTATRRAGALPILAWQEIGPAPVPNGQVQGGGTVPVSGRVTAVEIDPTDPNIVYVGTANGGVYRTTDGAAHWESIFDDGQSLAIGSLTLAPSDPTILYVGTGEANGSCDSFSGAGLYRIEAAKTTATIVGPINPIPVNNGLAGATGAFTGRSISRILVHPSQPGTIFVGTAGGVIGIGCDPPFDNSLPPLALRGLYRSANATAAPTSVSFERIRVPPTPPPASTPLVRATATSTTWSSTLVTRA